MCARAIGNFAGSVFRSSFLRNIATVSGGQVLAAAVPLLSAPFLGRLYSPEDYGPFGSLLAFVSVFGAVATGQYAQAVVMVRRESSGRVLIQLCMVVAVLVAGCSLPFGIWQAARATTVPGVWFLLLPVFVLISGGTACCAAMANRWQYYRRIALTQWISVMFSAMLSIGLGLKGFHTTGLLWAYFTSQALALGLGLWVVSPRFGNPFRHWSWRRIVVLAVRHRRFAIYTTPTGFIATATMNAPVFALNAIHSVTGVGLFNRAFQLLAMPTGLVGGAVAQVFQRRAAQDFHRDGHCRPLFAKTLLVLLGACLIPVLVLTLAAPTLFGWILGPDWVEAGHVARWLAPMLLLRVLCAPLSTVLYVAEAQRLDFVLTVLGCVLTWGGVAFGAVCFGSSDAVIGAYAASYSLAYVVFIAFAWKLAGGTAATRMKGKPDLVQHAIH